MRSHASLSLLLLAAAPAAAQEPPSGEGPRGSSQLAAGEVRYDAVGYATRGELPGISIGSRDLPTGSYAEVTALDTGRTIVAAVVGDDAPMTGPVILSGAAADALGLTDGAMAVRARRIVPTPQDIVALRGGGSASFRNDAPPALLVALRKKLPSKTPAALLGETRRTPASRPAMRTPPPSRATALRKPAAASVPAPIRGGYIVQVAALSSAARAETVAKAVGGTVVASPPVWRVRLGPYSDAAAAARAREDAARKGYPGGQITRTR